jgi:hypothetical protein
MSTRIQREAAVRYRNACLGQAVSFADDTALGPAGFKRGTSVGEGRSFG